MKLPVRGDTYPVYLDLVLITACSKATLTLYSN
jgi:hypothetical protein